MKRFFSFRTLSVLVLAAGFSSCASAPSVASADAEKARIEEVWVKYAKAASTGDVELYVSNWTRNGKVMRADTPIFVGIDAVRARVTANMAKIRENYERRMTISNEETVIMGPIAYCRGIYTIDDTPKAGGKTIHSVGKYLSILERQPDGVWKIAIDHATLDGKPVEK